MSKHTPGPWIAYISEPDLNLGYATVENHEGEHICGYHVYKSTAERCFANAHLISAAPELLEELKWIVQIFSDPTLAQERDFELWGEQAKAAIAKAEGN